MSFFDQIGLTLFSFDESLNVASVLPVGKDGQKAHDAVHLNQQSLGHSEDSALSHDDHLQEEGSVEDQRSKGHEMSREKGNEEGRQPAQEGDPVEAEDHTTGGSDSLSALKIHIEGKIMSQNTSQSGVYDQEIFHLRIGCSKGIADNDRSQDGLGHISRKDNESVFGTQYPKGVGGAGIAGTVLADVNSLCLSHYKSSLEQAQYITDQKTV